MRSFVIERNRPRRGLVIAATGRLCSECQWLCFVDSVVSNAALSPVWVRSSSMLEVLARDADVNLAALASFAMSCSNIGGGVTAILAVLALFGQSSVGRLVRSQPVPTEPMPVHQPAWWRLAPSSGRRGVEANQANIMACGDASNSISGVLPSSICSAELSKSVC